MTQRLNYGQQSPEIFKKLIDLSAAVKQSSIDAGLLHLVDMRVSQLNGCAFCLDMHVKEAKIHGESELRLYHVAIWRESNLFVPRERAALAWTEAVTRLPEGGISDELYERVRTERVLSLVGERVPEIAGISAPVFDGSNTLLGVITITVPTIRYRDELIGQVKAAAQALTAALGGDFEQGRVVPYSPGASR